jgi:hypothetical protein
MRIKETTDNLFVDKLFEELDNLLGKPVLLRGEDADKYLKLQRMIARQYMPEDLVGAVDVRELVDSMWQGTRFRELGTALVNAERRNASKKLTDPKSGYVPDTDKAAKAIKAHKTAPKVGMVEMSFRSSLGISESTLNAHAMILASDKFLVLDRLEANRTARRKTALKDVERRQRVAKGKRLAAKAKRERKSKRNDDPYEI